MKDHTLHWPEILFHLYITLLVGDFGSGKVNALLCLINHEPDFDKIYLYTKDIKISIVN